MIHEVKKSGSQGLVLKLDYEKAYDKVNWEFLFDMLQSRGFGNRWISWIKSIMTNSTFSVKINDTIGSHFLGGGKGSSKGIPPPPCFLIW